MKRSLIPALLTAAAILAPAAGAQRPAAGSPYAEYRVDAIRGTGTALQAGGGVTIPMGIYVRTAVIGALGGTRHDGVTSLSGRADVITRFLLDPLREMPVALSMGGGVSVPYAASQTRVRPYLTAVVDIEGKRRSGWSPAVQLGLGGGARLGIVLRGSPAQRR